MRILHQATGFFAVALLALNTASARAASEGVKVAPDAATAAAHAAAKGDGLLEALLTELERSQTQLKMNQVQAPYYIEYRVNEVEDLGIEAAFGALRENQHIHVRVLRVVVRVGDYKQDSYFARGQGETSILPLDNDPIALRRQLWLATDQAYKAAGQALAEKQAGLKQFSVDPNPVDDFAKARPVVAVEPTVSLRVDEAAWKKTLQDATSLYKQYPDMQSVTASARFTANNEYLVNSEGTVTRSGKTTYTVQLNGSAQAADGMRLSRSPAYMVARPNRTVGAFATSYKTRVLPNFLSIVDDPTLNVFQGKSLVGSYDLDSEGVKAQAVNVIENGTLTNYLVGRQPIRDFPASNGHGRAAPGSFPGPSLGVLLVKSSEEQRAEDLKKKIIQMVTDQGKPYGYRVETLGPGNSPRLLYRGYAKDGHEGTPTTIICPSLLFGELEVKRADTSKDKLPDYPPPPLKK